MRVGEMCPQNDLANQTLVFGWQSPIVEQSHAFCAGTSRQARQEPDRQAACPRGWPFRPQVSQEGDWSAPRPGSVTGLVEGV